MFGGSKLGIKFNHKSIKKAGQHGKATWHRFLIDFGGFWEASWVENQPKNDSRRHRKSYEKKKRARMDFDVLYGAKLGWEMATLCIPKGLQKTSEK